MNLWLLLHRLSAPATRLKNPYAQVRMIKLPIHPVKINQLEYG